MGSLKRMVGSVPELAGRGLLIGRKMCDSVVDPVRLRGVMSGS